MQLLESSGGEWQQLTDASRPSGCDLFVLCVRARRAVGVVESRAECSGWEDEAGGCLFVLAVRSQRQPQRCPTSRSSAGTARRSGGQQRRREEEGRSCDSTSDLCSRTERRGLGLLVTAANRSEPLGCRGALHCTPLPAHCRRHTRHIAGSHLTRASPLLICPPRLPPAPLQPPSDRSSAPLPLLQQQQRLTVAAAMSSGLRLEDILNESDDDDEQSHEQSGAVPAPTKNKQLMQAQVRGRDSRRAAGGVSLSALSQPRLLHASRVSSPHCCVAAVAV